MLKTKNNNIIGYSKPIIYSLFLFGVGALTPAYAADFSYPGFTYSDNNKLTGSDTLTIASGTYIQKVDSQNSGLTIIVEDGATFNPSQMPQNNAFKLIIESGGTAKMPGVTLSNGVEIENSGSLTFSSSVNTNGSIIITNTAKVDGYSEPVLTFSSNFQLGNQSEIHNHGQMITQSEIITGNNTSIHNTGTLQMKKLTAGGELINDGFLRAERQINLNANSTITNNCSYVALGGFNASANTPLINHGIIYTGDSEVNLNGGFAQIAEGYVQGNVFNNNKEVTGAGRYFFTGRTTSNNSFGQDNDPDGPINFYDEIVEGTQNGNEFFDNENSNLIANTIREPIEPIDEAYAISNCTYGSVEVGSDFGDAPEVYGVASHTITSSVYLGTRSPDAEEASQFSASAAGDNTGGTNDEDGVVFPSVEQSKVFELNIPVSGEGGYLQAWIDWNGDGDFSDLREQIATNYQDAGLLSDIERNDDILNLLVTVPEDTTEEATYARFRWSTDAELGPQGLATDGEVEDYTLTITPSESNSSCVVGELSESGYSGTAASTSSRFLSETTYVYTASFSTEDWSSEIQAYDLETESSQGGKKSEIWTSHDEISANSRDLFTYSPAGGSSSGTVLRWDNLTDSQKAVLADDDDAVLGSARVDWLYGETAGLRPRSVLLGDVINSSLTVKNPLTNYGYQALPDSEGSTYAAFLQSKLKSEPSLFVGSNGGLFHGLDARTGEELFAYAPNETLAKVPTISDVKYGCTEVDCLPHEYLVDGKSTLGDAYISNKWRTVVLGTLGLGGRGLFALDVTEPDNFSASDVLWEISATQAPDSAETFANYLGYTLPSASVVRAANGQWLAIAGNGYDSKSQQAVLFLIDIETGDLVKTINTFSGSVSEPNGLSTPTVVDSDGDAIADRIYAGDLLGNVWAFDISSDDSADWKVDYGSENAPKSLFQATNQPITAAPQVSKNKVAGLMVYVGTGKYTDVADGLAVNTEAAFDTFYAIQDNGNVVTKNELVEQEILSEDSVSGTAGLNSRVTSNNPVDYTTKRGWFLDFDVAGSEGERVVSQAILSGGRIIFTTLIPSANSCSFDGTSWVMELNAQDGSRLPVITFDLNDDLAFTTADNATYNGDSTTVSGVQLESLGVIRSSPEIVKHTAGSEGKYVSGSKTGVAMFRESASDFRGRMSWTNISN